LRGLEVTAEGGRGRKRGVAEEDEGEEEGRGKEGGRGRKRGVAEEEDRGGRRVRWRRRRGRDRVVSIEFP
jgi:hypothetical protein